MRKAIPTTNFDFKYLIQKNMCYVDKSDYLHMLVTSANNSFFISRPRRFGKSLMISSLKYIFEGRSDLFEGLKIRSTDYSWITYPVVHLNMASVESSSLESFQKSLLRLMKRTAQELDVEVDFSNELSDIFSDILYEAAKKSDTSQVVVLIDEYDAPLVNNIDEPHLEELRKLLASFYVQIKNCNSILRFTMMTGITRFSRVSVFSALNNLDDISMHPSYATMLGYTQEEVELYFGEQLEEFVRNQSNTSREIFLDKVRQWYNGFRFHPNSSTLYNPVSIGMFLNRGGEFLNYWFSTGSPTFVFRVLKEKDLSFFDSIDHLMPESLIDSFDPMIMDAPSLLLQTGYLTIKGSQSRGGMNLYKLGFPNLEVETAFNSHLISMLTAKPISRLSGELWDMSEALFSGDTDRLEALLKSHIASIPYGYRSDLEKSYQNILMSLFRLLGAEVRNEVHVNTGRVDCVIENLNHI
ncbi:MAG: AAA family ATPase, partial [Bacteroidales bacterium]